MKQKNKWQLNEEKAIAMTDKFIAALEKVDCYSNWASIMVDRIITKKMKDAKLHHDKELGRGNEN